MEKKKIIKAFYIIIGVLCLALGIVGIALPILPTTPFLLLASFLFMKSSEKMNNWLLNNKVFGEHIKDYQEYRAVKRGTKIVSIGFLWSSLGLSIYFVEILWIRLLLIGVGVGVTAHLLSLKTQKKRQLKQDWEKGEE